MHQPFLAFALLLAALPAFAFAPTVSKDAPPDKSVRAESQEQLEKMHKATAPYVKQAKKTYPAAKERFLKGLPAGEAFFITTRLHDEQGHEEQVFVAVVSIEDGTVSGVISSAIYAVAGYRNGQPYTFPESELVDWLISKPDGSEEGNVVGKFLDTYQP